MNDLLEDIALAIHDLLIDIPIVVCAVLLMVVPARAGTPPMYSLTTQPTILANKGLAPALGQDAVDISGKYHTLENLTITGGFHGIKLTGCSDITIANCVIRNPVMVGKAGGYCAYATLEKGTSDRVDFLNCTFEIDKDQGKDVQFPFRGYGLRDCRFIKCVFTNEGASLKASCKVADGKRVEFRDCTFTGWPPGIGRNNGEPYVCEDIVFRRCSIDMNGFLPANAPSLKINDSIRVSFEDCKIIQHANVAVLDLWSEVVFSNCTITGGSKLQQGGSAGTFPGSTYNGKAIP